MRFFNKKLKLKLPLLIESYFLPCHILLVTTYLSVVN